MEELDEGGPKCKLPVVSTGDIMYDMMTTVYMVNLKATSRINPKSSANRGKKLFLLFFLYLRDDRCYLNLLW